MASPMIEIKNLLTQLGGGGAPTAELAARVETIAKLLQRHSADELIKIAELLDGTSKAKDRAVALDAAKAEVGKLPVAEAAEVADRG